MNESPDSGDNAGGFYRYPGPTSFNDSPTDARLFFGRQVEIADLCDRVLSDRLLVLYGKSGIGKTSLLKAGVFPELRARNYLPLYLRFQEHSTIVETVDHAVSVACREHGYQFTPGEGRDLWEYLHSLVITRAGVFLTPVLVLDHFEELLRDSGDSLQDVVRAIGPLVSGHSPDRYAEKSVPVRAPDVRVVISLREEYVGTLQTLTDSIPGIFQNRYRLEPLSRGQAEIAITRPAHMDDEQTFRTLPFEFQVDAVDEILNFIESNQTIDPIQLQVICHYAEQFVENSSTHQQQPLAVADFLPDRARLDHIVSQFYLDSVKQLSDRKQRNAVRNLCEYGLISRDGFRESLSSRNIKEKYQLDEATLQQLVDMRLLRAENRLNDHWYELTHDRLAEAVHSERRTPVSQKTAIAMATLVLVAITGWLFFAQQQQAAQEELWGEVLRNQTHPHNADVAGCGDCHGNDIFAPVNAISQPCLECHASTAEPMTDFEESHQSFQLGQGNQSFGDLKFPHDIHLDDTSMGTKSPLCVDCHAIEAGAWGVTPLTFETACEECHALQFDVVGSIESGFTAATVDHVDFPAVYRQLYAHYLAQIYEPKSNSSSRPRRSRPEARPDKVACSDSPAECVRQKTDETMLELGTRSGCVTCHEVRVFDRQTSSTYGPDIQILWNSANRSSSVATENRVPVRHSAHLTRMGRTGGTQACELCHQATYSSVSNDLLIPPMEECRQCHVNPENGSDSPQELSACSTCHKLDFHPL